MRAKALFLIALGALTLSANAANDLKLGDWYCIGPFKSEEFGNIDRTLDYLFAPEKDHLQALKQGAELPLKISKTYRMKAFPGYLDLDRNWEQRGDWSDGFYNLLPRGPAPSRNEAVYIYRSIESSRAQTVTMHLRMQDFYKVILNGEEVHRFVKLTKESRYSYPEKVTLDLDKGINHLLIKNVSRWAEHGFSFGVESMHQIEDNFYYDINHHSITDVDEAENYLRRFKFSARPIPMHSPSSYALEAALKNGRSSPEAAEYDLSLRELEFETLRLLQAKDEGRVPDEQLMTQAEKLYEFLGEQVEILPPIVFLRKPLHYQNAIAPYDNIGSLPAEICLIEPSIPEAEPRVIFSKPDMRILDMNLSFDAKTIFFSAKDNGDRYAWNIYEIGVDGSGFKQITSGDSADIYPCELPNGRLAFVSTRRDTYVVCQTRAAGLLYTMNRDGSDVRLISGNIDSDHRPQVTNDGRILFTRWDYGVEKNVFARHGLWTVNPDGTSLKLVFGNTIEDPGGFWDAQPIPGRPEILAVFGPHHNYHAGMLGLVLPDGGPEQPRGTGYRWITREYPIYGDRIYPDGYQAPYPVNEKQFIASFGGTSARPSVEAGKTREYEDLAPLKLLYIDAYGNERVIYKAGGNLSCYNPLLLRPREKPTIIADKIPPIEWSYQDPEQMNRCDEGAQLTGTMLVQDVYQGISRYVERGEAKFIAVMEQVQKSREMVGGEAWGHTPLIGRGTVHARRLVGLVPVEEDGSAFFEVPAQRSLSLNVLNEEGKAIMRMGSDIHVMPNEMVSCIGCHEQRESGYGAAPPFTGGLEALMKLAAIPKKQDWGTQGLIDYPTVVQPVWDKHCVECHSGSNPDGYVDMTDDKTRFFNQSYDQLVDRDIVDHLSVFSLEHDEGTPRTVGAMVSRIDEFMSEEHCGSEISWEERFRVYCWIDANVPYYGTYEYRTYPEFEKNKDGVRGIGARDGWESKSKSTNWAQGTLQHLFDNRCADCHEREVLNQSWYQPMRMKVYSDAWGDKALTSHGFGSNKWKLVNKLGPEYRINLTNPEFSLFLQAPLAKESGGASLCETEDGTPVFADKMDPDYKAALEAIQLGSDRLKRFPRIDMDGREGFMAISAADSK